MCGWRKGLNELFLQQHWQIRRRRVAEQESMSETVQKIKEQVMNLARRPSTSAPDDTDDESDDDDYV
ncbi:hypothetical protein MTR67_019670 [Solanum verrucosum]|uniref:Uncharacterized protein n=1 Tax=Solanum verrucosum TaxID=315347 RepID=A0AAF0QPM0_SOLVR|nr:hypothetical protein MTR67_019670 [Solanum verrucosum]